MALRSCLVTQMRHNVTLILASTSIDIITSFGLHTGMIPKRSAVLLMLILGCTSVAVADSVTNTISDTNSIIKFNWPVGEKISYRLYWGYIPVGTAIISTGWTNFEGRCLLAIRMRTLSNKVIEKVYPVDDTIESLVDTNKFLPVKFMKRISEGSYRCNETTTFDRTNLVARWVSTRFGTNRVFAIEAETRDIPSFMYYMRSRKFEPGKKEHFRVMADEKVYDLWLNIQKPETVDALNYDDVACVKIEPEAAFNGLFVRKGKMWTWISTDPRCLAVKFVASVPVANVRGLLESVEGPGTDFWIKTNSVPATK